jgi:hypothetical protein
VALSRSRAVAAITLFVAPALIFGSSAALAPAADALASHTTITAVDGDVFISHHGEDFSAARAGDVLAAGDTVRTGAQASAEITYFEGSSIVLEPETELVVKPLVGEPHGGNVFGVVNTLGRTWHVVTKLMSGGSRYEFRTPSSTASVRG